MHMYWSRTEYIVHVQDKYFEACRRCAALRIARGKKPGGTGRGGGTERARGTQPGHPPCYPPGPGHLLLMCGGRGAVACTHTPAWVG